MCTFTCMSTLGNKLPYIGEDFVKLLLSVLSEIPQKFVTVEFLWEAIHYFKCLLTDDINKSSIFKKCSIYRDRKYVNK